MSKIYVVEQLWNITFQFTWLVVHLSVLENEWVCLNQSVFILKQSNEIFFHRLDSISLLIKKLKMTCDLLINNIHQILIRHLLIDTKFLSRLHVLILLFRTCESNSKLLTLLFNEVEFSFDFIALFDFLCELEVVDCFSLVKVDDLKCFGHSELIRYVEGLVFGHDEFDQMNVFRAENVHN